MQPSAQGIASLYMGNPGALQQKVQREQQAKPGIPPDLKNLMALNIVTNEQDASKRQEAMNALRQMAPGGQPPTVAQSIQEQAKQKMQAQMIQQQRQQQGLQALMQAQQSPMVPANTPQPEQQPEAGIDQLPVEMGFAGGGIVAFADGDRVEYETPYDRMNRENEERAAREREERIAQIRASGNEEGATTAGIGEVLRALGSSIDKYVPDPVQLFRRLVSDPSLAKQVAAQSPAVAQIPVGAERIESAAPEIPQAPTPVAAVQPAAPQVKKSIADLVQPTAPQMARPAQMQAPAAPQESDTAKKIAAMVGASPESAYASGVERYKAAVAAPETTQLDRLIEELERRKSQFEAPKQGWDAFTEYMQQIAQAGPQRTWYEAGAKGAAGVRGLEEARQKQQHEITKQQIEAAQKKADIGRAYSMEMYKAGMFDRDQTLKDQLKAIEMSNLNENEKRKLETKAVEDAKDRAAALERTKISAGAPGAAERISAQILKLRSEGRDEEANKLLETYTSVTGAGAAGVGAQRNELTRLKNSIAAYEKIADPMSGYPEADQTKAKQEIVRLTRQLAKVEETGNELSMTMDDVRATAKASGKSEADVMAAAKARGYIIK